MPARWQEWEKAKKEIKEDATARSSAVDEALGVLRSSQKAAKEDPNALRCPICGGMKFKTREKGKTLVCRSCGMQVQNSAPQSKENGSEPHASPEPGGQDAPKGPDPK
ncbi:MAG: hypothetical protein FJ319_13675 [SAR202 cluster bacterium]|nr:hypothetical protein [SAR202 cluster bacterium]